MYYNGSYNYWPRGIPRIIPIPITSINSKEPVKSSDDLKKTLLEHIDTKFAALSSSMPKDGTINIEQLKRELKDTLKKEMGTFIKEQCVGLTVHKDDITNLEGAFNAKFTEAATNLASILTQQQNEITLNNASIQSLNTRMDTNNSLLSTRIYNLETQLTTEIDNVSKSVVENIRKQIEQLKKEFARQYISEENFIAGIEQLNTQFQGELTSVKQELTKYIREAQPRINELITRYNQIMPRLETLEADFKTRAREIGVEVGRINGILDRLEENDRNITDLQQLRQAYTNLEPRITEMLSQSEGNIARLDQMQIAQSGRMSGIDTKLGEMQATHTENIARLNQMQKAQNSRISDINFLLTDTRKTHEGRMSDIEQAQAAQAAAEQAARQAAADRISGIDTRLGEMNATHEGRMSGIEQTQAAQSSLIAQLRDLTNQIPTILAQHADMSEYLDLVLQDITLLKAQKTEFERNQLTITQLQSQLNERIKTLESLNKRLAEEGATVFNTAKRDTERLDTKITSLNSENMKELMKVMNNIKILTKRIDLLQTQQLILLNPADNTPAPTVPTPATTPAAQPAAQPAATPAATPAAQPVILPATTPAPIPATTPAATPAAQKSRDDALRKAKKEAQKRIAEKEQKEKQKQQLIEKAKQDEKTAIIIQPTDSDLVKAVKIYHQNILEKINYMEEGLNRIPQDKQPAIVNKFKINLDAFHTKLLEKRKTFDEKPTDINKQILINSTAKPLKDLLEIYQKQIVNIGRPTKQKYDIYLSETSEDL